MKDRLCRMGRRWAGALCLLATCGLTYSSCSDDYDLPDTKPSWLGSSIYNYLNSAKDGNGKPMYTNMIRLIDSLDYKDVLARTGSKTLFVADDAAFAEFFGPNNPWGVHSFDALTKNQMKLLLNGSMLDNAYLLEMMTNIPASDGVTKNKCLRQVSSASVTDSIGYLTYDSGDIPVTYSATDPDYWKRFRQVERLQPGDYKESKNGLYLATDGTTPMMTHFLNGQLSENNITTRDFEVIVGETRTSNDAHIYGTKVIDQDVTCLNGYVNRLDKVLLTPPNMAEALRTSGKTNIFSHMLDRFSAPFYDASLTRSYSSVFGLGENDSVFVKRYFSQRALGGNALTVAPDRSVVNTTLSFDPGWNQYYAPSSEKEVDMAAMFVPSDEALYTYFLPGGGGEYLVKAYGIKDNTRENLLENIDQIPLSAIRELVNNMMKPSFNASVPSKYITIMNDARDPMFSSIQGGVEGFISTIDTCMIANNGVVYVLNNVIVPAAYASVSSPTMADPNLSISQWIIHADDDAATNPSNAKLGAFFNAYLLAMSSRFSFFIPTNEAYTHCYDPISWGVNTPGQLKLIEWKPSVVEGGEPTAVTYTYDPETGQTTGRPSTSTSQAVLRNRLKDLMDGHIVVHSEDEKTTGILSGNEFYLTKAGSAVQIKNLKMNGGQPVDEAGFHVLGGFQMDSVNLGKDAYCAVKEVFNRTQEATGYGNGMSYIVDRLIQPTVRSVYRVLGGKLEESEVNPYEKFFTLCNEVNDEIIEAAGFVDSLETTTEKKNEYSKYKFFDASGQCVDMNIRFFNAYRYTVFVPTNEAIDRARAKGLPNWDEIQEVIDKGRDEVSVVENDPSLDESQKEEQIAQIEKRYKTQAQSMVITLVNFLKYHFMDTSVFADKGALPKTELETACMDNATNRYLKLNVSREQSNDYNLTVTDRNNHDYKVTGEKNIMARDMELKGAAAAAMSATIDASSFSVVHQLDGYLNFMDESVNERFDDPWRSGDQNRMKKFINEYRIKK